MPSLLQLRRGACRGAVWCGVRLWEQYTFSTRQIVEEAFLRRCRLFPSSCA